MGNLLGGVSFREPTTVEDCDSTWQTDSEPEPDEPGPGGGGQGPGQEPEQPAQPPERAGGRPRASPAPDEDAEPAGAEQVRGPGWPRAGLGRPGPWRREGSVQLAGRQPVPSPSAWTREPGWRGTPGRPLRPGAWPSARRKVPPGNPNSPRCFLCLCSAAG
jgi:hypothetical protein